LFKEYKIIVDSKYVFSKGENVKLSDEVKMLILNTKEYFEKMFEECVEIIDRPTTPSAAKKLLDNYAKENGKF
jgi:hypothetical protein